MLDTISRFNTNTQLTPKMKHAKSENGCLFRMEDEKKNSNRFSMRKLLSKKSLGTDSTHSFTTECSSSHQNSTFNSREFTTADALKSCLKGSRARQQLNSGSSHSSSGKKLKVRFPSSGNMFLRTKSTLQPEVQVIERIAFQYKTELFWSKQDERRFSEDPGLTSRQEAETADLYVQTFLKAQAIVYNNTLLQSQISNSGEQQPNQVQQDHFFVLLLGRKAGFAGIEQYQADYKNKRSIRVKKVIKLVLQRYTELVNECVDDTASIATQLRQAYRTATASDRYWAKVMGLADSQAAAEVHNVSKLRNNPTGLSDMNSKHSTHSNARPHPPRSPMRNNKNRTWHPTLSSHSHDDSLDGDSGHSAASFY